ncbi:MAG: inorganic phosphate transporter [Candidatus Margulisiibacteriota bacterium]|nr:MAG: inorganic phosphate transporter [Candidatus Margulisbacteria bacterium GWD2_39_127]OGI01138.1 MAG: inorganic phosphate transporter [Candidatus Margulisbacteria bacterium GWF2_38_17]OGI10544.1 MAG: inorganic phosphate transporter [Candidatus Margulisbacteria bacterium GWE2_39_32]PZM78844.1 MAG: inorganic phosphate transporter [Candidatus Margulisiibacteriota bacterium]HAR64576.1 anion permease [Candidatus Margulisiibacteriota bacterium]
MISTLTLVIIVIIVALMFDFVNGFHDAANAIATIVVTRTLTPLQAVILAGCANFVGYFAFGTAVAKMIGNGVVNIEFVTLPLILATIVGAIIWNIITWIFGIPTSSSHALIGGLIGAGVAAVGTKVVVASGVLKIFLFIFIAPMLGMLGAMIFTTFIIWLFRKSTPYKSKGIFKKLQLVAAVFSSIGHGTNDAQKTMGIIALALFAAHYNATFKIDNWVVLSCYVAISLGTFFGGWSIVKTMGTSITKIREMEGFCSGTASAFVLMVTAHFGIPVSTTHVMAGSIMGVGSVQHARSVRWITARKILWAWIITIPAAAFFAAITYFATSLLVS